MAIISGSPSRSRSTPFWEVSRVIIPMRGARPLLRPMSHFLEQGRLAGLFPLEGVRAVRARQVGVPSGVPFVIIRPVQDSVEVLLAPGQHPLQPVSHLLGQNLPAVARAHGVQDVGREDPSLEEVHLPPELDPLHRKERVRQPGPGKLTGWKHPLVGDVVKRQQRPGSSETARRTGRRDAASKPGSGPSASRDSAAHPGRRRGPRHREKAALQK